MFRFTAPAPRALAATAAFLILCPAAAVAQIAAQTTTQRTPPPPPRDPSARRRNATRLARMARNIQDAYSHRYEVAGGGGFLRFRTGETLQKITEINFFMTGAYNLNPKWSVIADVRGMYGNANIPNALALNGSFSPQISEYTFTGGAQRRLVAAEKYTVSAAATAGLAMSKFSGDSKGLLSTDLGMWPDSNAKPAFTVSLIGDYNIYNNLALRVQPTYVGTTFGNTVQNNLGVNFGVVYRFGRQK